MPSLPIHANLLLSRPLCSFPTSPLLTFPSSRIQVRHRSRKAVAVVVGGGGSGGGGGGGLTNKPLLLNRLNKNTISHFQAQIAWAGTLWYRER
ncbi:hypothetical protein E2C01_074516 [Portunus trituberculatus]|uniref:Uncharacterized protein n=1 Tax=Portunus trituberculatus TaxID=210409 RepID=A0A5B7IDC9_PORTR|nr:hypothetical protein [Portunus trituberculatus]